MTNKNTNGVSASSVASYGRTICIVVAMLYMVKVMNVKIVSDETMDSQKSMYSPSLSNALTLTPNDNSKEPFISLERQNQWIDNEFKAADPAEHEWCVNAMKEGTYFQKANRDGAQFSQDIFIARNLFMKDIMKGKKGFYIEAGANHYRDISSTWFYDKCLGWDGLCVEPQARYQDDIRKYRSCTLVPMCITKERIDMIFQSSSNKGAGMQVKPMGPEGVPTGWTKVECASLNEIMASYSGGRTYVDLFILDVEGEETNVLNAIDWERLSFGAILIEDGRIPSPKRMDYQLSMKGYELFHMMAIDSLYIRRKQETLWYPPDWQVFEGVMSRNAMNNPNDAGSF